MNVQFISKDQQALLKQIQSLPKQQAFAQFKAINETMGIAQKALKTEIIQAFDNPTPFVQNAFRLDYATKQKAVASIRLKDRGSAEDVKRLTSLFMTQIRGGTRADKKSELGAKKYNAMPSYKNLVPVRTARRNRYGNITKSMMTKIFASVAANRIGRGTKTDRWFYDTLNGVSGVWERKGKRVNLVMVEASQARYKQKFDFYGLIDQSVNANFDMIHARWLKRALKTAR